LMGDLPSLIDDSPLLVGGDLDGGVDDGRDD